MTISFLTLSTRLVMKWRTWWVELADHVSSRVNLTKWWVGDCGMLVAYWSGQRFILYRAMMSGLCPCQMPPTRPRHNDSSSIPQIINTDIDCGFDINTSTLKATQKYFFRLYSPQLRRGTINNTWGHIASYKRFIKSKTHTRIIGATKHQAHCIIIVVITLHTFPMQCN